ncbi:MAG: hypothetical protein MUQ32_17925, partial [Chloroflexi bacterium]|nr:hypothetical protein [Chloroflexota bacterium]
MTDLLRRSRSLAVALAVLAISATVAFAAAPQARISSPTPLAEKASETPEASETTEPSESPEASETPEASESAEPSEAPKAAEAVETAGTEPKDTHGAVVSMAAQMDTPPDFANHGAFVSCVAHMDTSAVDFDLNAVDAASCAVANPKA